MDRFLSRKFIMSVVTALLVILNDGLGWGIDADTILQAVYVILGYIFAEGTRDVVATYNGTFYPLGKDEREVIVGFLQDEDLTE